jgi:hypothetical protein
MEKLKHGDPYKKENKFKLCHNEVCKQKKEAQQITLCVCSKVEKEVE